MGAVAVSGMETSLADFTGNFFVAVVAPKFFEGRMVALSRERVDKLHWSLALRATWSVVSHFSWQELPKWRALSLKLYIQKGQPSNSKRECPIIRCYQI
jgi:hypothetical protein